MITIGVMREADRQEAGNGNGIGIGNEGEAAEWSALFRGPREIRKREEGSQEIVETCATYWHTVDFLWILIFALLYVMR